MIRNRLAPLCIAVAFPLIVTGCGNGDDETTTAAGETGSLAAELEGRVADGNGEPGPLAGTWTGELSQRGQDPFPIRVTIGSLTDPAENPVRYGGAIDCGGNWTFEPDAGSGDTVELTEQINRGEGGNCKGSGTVSLTATADPDELDYVFVGGGIESSGTIERSAP